MEATAPQSDNAGQTNACTHETLIQTSKLYVRWYWSREADGSYDPDDTYSKVLDEETIDFECADCGMSVSLDGDCKLEVEDDEDDEVEL